MGIFGKTFSQTLSDMSQPQSGAGTPAKAPGKQTLTAGIPPRSAPARPGVDAADGEFIEHGHVCSVDPNQEGCIFTGPDAAGQRMRLGQLIGAYLPLMNADMHAAIGRLLLDTKLAKAPASLALILVGFAFDVLSSGLVSKIGAFAKATSAAATVAKGVSQATDQSVSSLVNGLSRLPVKQVETVAKTLSGVMKDKVKGAVGKAAAHDFESNRAAKVAFLQKIQNGLSAVAIQMFATYTQGSDVDALVLLGMLEHRPDVDGFEEKFRDLVGRYIAEQVPNIGKKAGITEAEYKLLCVVAYGQKLYINVLTAEGPRVGAKPRMVGAGGQNKDIVDPDKPAELVAIISPDLVSTAIENNGGKVEEVSVTWEAYRDGNWSPPVPTLDLRRPDGNLFGPGMKFEQWLRKSYQDTHGGHEPPDDAFSWDNTFGGAKQAPPASSAPQVSGNGVDAVADAADATSGAFDLF